MSITRLAGIAAGASPALLPAMIARMGGRFSAAHQASAGPLALSTATPGNGWHDDGALAVAFDGLIFNRDVLAAPPEANDAAVLAGLFRRHGLTGALDRLNADFACAILDRAAGRLHLARDRFGVKPLYYAARGPLIAFASRPAGLFASGLFDPMPRADYLATFAGGHYRFFDNPPEATPYEGIAQLAPGTVLTVAGGAVATARWYALSDQGDDGRPLEALAEDYRALFRDAVARRLTRLARPAFTLSGGLDSTSVATTAALLSCTPAHAYSTVYGGGVYDETAEIRDALSSGRLDWHPVELGGLDLFGELARLTPLHDQPLSTVTWLAHAALCEAVQRAGHDGLLGGLGGDEQHAGEYDYFFYFFADLKAAGETLRLAHEIACWKRHHDHPVWRKSPAVAEAAMARLTDAGVPGRVRPDLGLATRYAEALMPEARRAIAATLEGPYRSYLKSHAFNEIYRETMPCCLRASERNTAALGLSDCFPFFDHRLVEFAMRVPSTLKIRDGVTKQLLRAAMAGTLPEATRKRIGKTGWNAPLHRWLAGPLKAPLLDLVRSRAFRERGLYRPEAVERLIAEHATIVEAGAARENHMMFLWQLISLETWLRGLDARRVAA
jgi:asparagine synthase (glutamine-hydrolysing)